MNKYFVILLLLVGFKSFSQDLKPDAEKKWKPAMQNGSPVVSKKVIKINFTSDHFDHE